MPTIIPLGAPAPESTAPSPGQASARERAIAKLMGPSQTNQSQQAPVQNPSQVSAEDLSAIKPSTPSVESQSNTTDSSTQTEPSKEVTPTKEAPLSSQYAHLARREKAINEKAQSVRQQTDALKAREDAIAAKEAQMSQSSQPSFEQRFEQDPWAAITEKGITYDQLTQRALNQPSPEVLAYNAEIKALKAEIDAIKQGQESSQKTYKDAQEQGYQQAVTQLRREAERLVTSDPNFESIKETGQVNEVVRLIERTFKEDNVLLSVEEAAQMVEDEIIERAVATARIGKIQKRLQPPEAPKQAAPAPVQQPPVETKTLSNNMGAAGRMTSRQRAILAFEGKLKQ